MESKSWHGRSRSRRWLVAIVAICLMVAACGGGGGGGDAGLSGGGGSLVPFAINDAASPALAADVRNLLEPGDRYQYEPNVAAANAILDGIWAQLTAHATWTASNPLNTYQFYIDTDPNTHWGRAYRFTGFSVYAGPVVPFTAGTYTRANGATYPAVALQTWDSSYAEILVLTDSNNFAHAIQNTNGLPITDLFHAP